MVPIHVVAEMEGFQLWMWHRAGKGSAADQTAVQVALKHVPHTSQTLQCYWYLQREKTPGGIYSKSSWKNQNVPRQGRLQQKLIVVLMVVRVMHSHPTLWKPPHYSLPGSSVHGILQASTLEWVAVPFSRVSSQPRDQTHGPWIAGRFFTVWTPGKLMLLLKNHTNGRKWGGIKEPLDEGERGEWKSWLKTQHWKTKIMVPSLHGK